VAAIVMWNLWDGSAWLARGGIIEQNLQPKPAYEALRELITHEWSTDLTIKTNARGEALGRGFYGTYEVTVTAPGAKSEEVRQTLERGTPGRPARWKVQLGKR